jgi:hypothetical protein
MNDRLEDELRKALRRVQPSEGFADRVLASLPERRSQTRTRRYWFMTIAAALVLVFFAHFEQKEYEAQRRAAQVQREVTFAFRLTAEKLAVIDGHLRRSAPELQIEKEKGE